MSEALARRCAERGIDAGYHDIFGQWREAPAASLEALLAELGEDEAARAPLLPPVVRVAPDTVPWTLATSLPAPQPGARIAWRLELEDGTRREGELEAGGTLEIPVALPLGYHRIELYDPARRRGFLGEALLLAAPPRCYLPPALEEGPGVWGPAVQLYGVRSARNWGMGDFTDLVLLAEQWGARGAGIVGLNPLHALFLHNPAHASPYSPSSRLRLNVLYLDVEAVEDFRECDAARRHVAAPAFQARLERLRSAPLVDYAGVARAKLEVLELLYASFRERQVRRASERSRAFRDFQSREGEPLRRHALWEALQARFHAGDASVWGWLAWPEAFRDPESGEVARFCAEQLERVEFHEYLQWLAEAQLERAAARCRSLGLAVGLYLDVAVSVDRAGSDTWAHRGSFALASSIGAPPDDFNPQGQDWGLPPLRPGQLRAGRYQLFIQALRSAMRHAGAVRIDHVMGLMRLFWIPQGAGAAGGAYVRYPLEDLLAILALESVRHRCLVVGEDLGTVPDEVREALVRAGVLSCRLLFFEQVPGGELKAPGDYPRQALAAASTHDLPTLAAWWRDRPGDRARLLRALERAGQLPPGGAPDPELPGPLTPALARAVHVYLARSPARVVMLQLEDALGLLEQANVPGSTEEHPNWRRKLPLGLERMAEAPGLARLAAALREARPHPERPRAAGAEARIPRATYRLQLHRGFTFEDAAALAPYLARLGVSHLYCSSILRARPGSLHWYDIVEHGEINPELGGREGLERLARALRAQGLGLILDVVPNHMAVFGADNRWWMDVLENGPGSAYARYFDIDWLPVNAELAGKVLAPILGDHYGEVLARGELELELDAAGGRLAVRYHEHLLPLDPRDYGAPLERAGTRLEPQAPQAARDELANLAAAFARLPARDAAALAAERARDKDALKQRFAQLLAAQPAAAQAVRAALGELAADADALHALLEAQAYRLAFWRVASDEINYRRFFDVNGLAALRVEDEAVFEATHALLLELCAGGLVDGLRIDHPDGLHDPEQYFARLQQAYARRAGLEAAPRPRGARAPRPLYVVAEKITAGHERLSKRWAVHGTTGYRFGAVVNGLFVDPSARGRMDRIWSAFSGVTHAFAEAAYQGKRAIARSALASELTVLATELLRIARADRRTRDYTFMTLRQALAEVAASMPVYRTYIAARASPQDRRYVDWAVAHATRHSRAADTTIFAFVRKALLGRALRGAPAGLAERLRGFAMKFQQFSGPLMAKGVEDTAFYAWSRLASLNEVGSDPEAFGMTPRAFHGASADRAAHWPHTMLATSTHDSKRSEDARLRIDVLSEAPAAWRLLLRRWSTLNRSRLRRVHAEPAPSRADEYLFYQQVIGTFPAADTAGEALAAYRERLEQATLKAAREAKQRTSWISPDEEYEQALLAFVRACLDDAHANPFLEDLRAQLPRIAWIGALNGISMALLKFTSPGVPDLYQGNELHALSLMDPDNRRPVDFRLRARLLEEVLGQPFGGEAWVRDGRAKLCVIARLLGLRREQPALFRDGSYVPLEARGERAPYLVAYARRHEGRALVVIAGRLFATLPGEPERLPLGEGCWGDTGVAVPGLDPGVPLENVLTGETLAARDGAIRLARAFATFPAAALLA